MEYHKIYISLPLSTHIFCLPLPPSLLPPFSLSLPLFFSPFFSSSLQGGDKLVFQAITEAYEVLCTLSEEQEKQVSTMAFMRVRCARVLCFVRCGLMKPSRFNCFCST